MTIEVTRNFLLWCTLIDYGILLVWFLFFAFAHDWIQQLHGSGFVCPVISSTPFTTPVWGSSRLESFCSIWCPLSFCGSSAEDVLRTESQMVGSAMGIERIRHLSITATDPRHASFPGLQSPPRG